MILDLGSDPVMGYEKNVRNQFVEVAATHTHQPCPVIAHVHAVGKYFLLSVQTAYIKRNHVKSSVDNKAHCIIMLVPLCHLNFIFMWNCSEGDAVYVCP